MDEGTVQAITLLKDLPITFVLLFLLLRHMSEQMKLVEYLETITNKLIDQSSKVMDKLQDEARHNPS